jgi:hypothetical protein
MPRTFVPANMYTCSYSVHHNHHSTTSPLTSPFTRRPADYAPPLSRRLTCRTAIDSPLSPRQADSPRSPFHASAAGRSSSSNPFRAASPWTPSSVRHHPAAATGYGPRPAAASAAATSQLATSCSQEVTSAAAYILSMVQPSPQQMATMQAAATAGPASAAAADLQQAAAAVTLHNQLQLLQALQSMVTQNSVNFLRLSPAGVGHLAKVYQSGDLSELSEICSPAGAPAWLVGLAGSNHVLQALLGQVGPAAEGPTGAGGEEEEEDEPMVHEDDEAGEARLGAAFCCACSACLPASHLWQLRLTPLPAVQCLL